MGMSKCCKVALLCVIAVVVVLAVAIPVGIFVIAPKVGQAAVNMVEMHVDNATLVNVTQVGATMVNQMTLQSDLFLGAELEEVVITMVASNPEGEQMMGMTNGPLGNFTMPKQTITQGTNKINFTADMFFNASADGGFRYMEWTLGLTMGDYVQHVTMIAEPTVKAFGFLTIKTKLEKHMVCNCLEPTPGCVAHKTPDNSSRLSREVPKFGDDGVMTVYMFCEPAGVPAWSGRPNVTMSLPSLRAMIA